MPENHKQRPKYLPLTEIHLPLAGFASFLHHFCMGIRILLQDMHIGIELPAACGAA